MKNIFQPEGEEDRSLGKYSQDTTIPDEEMTQYLESVLSEKYFPI